MKTLYCLIIGLAALLSVPLSANELFEARLENGMRLLVREDHRAPLVVSQLWYKVGSMDEPAGITGISHMLEHMMFKGTKQFGPGEFSRLIDEVGGEQNAFTGQDFTVYYEKMPKDKLALALKLEADRMANLLLDEKEFLRERAVVIEERRLRVEDAPQSLFFERFMAAAYLSHPYQQPIIGWMNDLHQLSVSDIQSWYHRWYAPENATLVIVGDISGQEALPLVKKYFANIKGKKSIARKAYIEIAPKGMRTLDVYAKTELPSLTLAYPVPVLNDIEKDTEPYALALIQGLLDAGASSRLPAKLVRQGNLAVEAHADYSLVQRGPSLFSITAIPAANTDLSALKLALEKEIEAIQTAHVSDEELERVRAQIISSRIFQQDSMFYQALLIGQLDNAGLDPKKLDLITERLKTISKEEIQQVAKKYFTPSRSVYGRLLPERKVP
jgi:zinc protease